MFNKSNKLPVHVRNAIKLKRKLERAERKPRDRLGYSIEEFADLIGVGRSSIYKSGRRSPS
jgi:DNA-binding XRE family transcriptional regulator